MSLLAQIKKDNLIARKEGDKTKAGLLTTLSAEAAMVGKNNGNRESTDAEVTAVIQKFAKNTNETISVLEGAGKDASKEIAERDILTAYLPTQLSDDELRSIVEGFLADGIEKSPKSMGQIMGKLKGAYDGQYDGKAASQIVREVLNS